MSEPIKRILKLVEKEVTANGISKTTGRPYTIYRYLGEDGEHYKLFDDVELDKNVELVGTEKEWQGKTVTEWKIVQPGRGAYGGGNQKAVLEKLDFLTTQQSSVVKMLEKVLTALNDIGNSLPR